MREMIVALMIVMAIRPASAHGTDAHSSGATWTFDPWIVAPLAIMVIAYALGSVKILRRTAHGNGAFALRFGFFVSGWAALAAALTSPLHWLGEHLFTFHMIEHEVVMAVSAPLLALSRPVSAFVWALPRRGRHIAGAAMNSAVMRRIWDWSTRGLNATLMHGVAIWAWHLPWLFDASVNDINLHRLQHLSFLITALLFWWSILWGCSRGVAAWHLFVTMVHTGILGALMALAPRVLYLAQTADAQAWGLTPLEDQQLAGMLMWVPTGTVYAGAALIMLALWIKASGSRGFSHV
ncbi:Membrane protein-like protein [Agrobacterium tumefaciens str. Kerr 14]|uniref:Membrane protein-like protein n=1 Tax=Agrobacterium tumefaciens str. Kerr 14 TaxID=1183424 RepID=A0A1S7SFV0_AGRTU|nr:cytochrome c oxidase assembly protein [Agrobacterium tumefaciens]CUX67823.1 Membrane protein-like protein [Agrobacterium tumefaciens str. Kerr 14]